MTAWRIQRTLTERFTVDLPDDVQRGQVEDYLIENDVDERSESITAASIDWVQKVVDAWGRRHRSGEIG